VKTGRVMVLRCEAPPKCRNMRDLLK